MKQDGKGWNVTKGGMGVGISCTESESQSRCEAEALVGLKQREGDGGMETTRREG